MIKKDETSTKSKKISDMSDDELRATLNRMQLEKNTMDLQRQISSLNAQNVSTNISSVFYHYCTTKPAILKISRAFVVVQRPFFIL